MMSSKPTTEKGTPERWTYLGCRYFGPNVGVRYVWQQPNGDEAHYKKPPKGATPGVIYEVCVEHSAEGVSYYPASRRYVDTHPNAKHIQAQHATDITRWRAEGQAKQVEGLDDLTLAELRVKLRKLPSGGQRALLACILSRLGY